MKMSPIYPGGGGGDEDEVGKIHEQEFDPNADFAQFLEEAKRHACEGESKGATQHIEETGKAQSHGREKNKRKSWKTSLFSWLKSKILVEPLHGATAAPKPRRRGLAFSGPIHGGSGLNRDGSRSRKTTTTSSGALSTSFFNPAAKREEAIDGGIGIPYVNLSHLSNPPLSPAAPSYGPVYLVT